MIWGIDGGIIVFEPMHHFRLMFLIVYVIPSHVNIHYVLTSHMINSRKEWIKRQIKRVFVVQHLFTILWSLFRNITENLKQHKLGTIYFASLYFLIVSVFRISISFVIMKYLSVLKADLNSHIYIKSQIKNGRHCFLWFRNQSIVPLQNCLMQYLQML